MLAIWSDPLTTSSHFSRNWHPHHFPALHRNKMTEPVDFQGYMVALQAEVLPSHYEYHSLSTLLISQCTPLVRGQSHT